jgi:hypothetical protein
LPAYYYEGGGIYRLVIQFVNFFEHEKKAPRAGPVRFCGKRAAYFGSKLHWLGISTTKFKIRADDEWLIGCDANRERYVRDAIETGPLVVGMTQFTSCVWPGARVTVLESDSPG